MNHRKRMVAAFSTVARLGRVVLLVFAMVAAAWPSGARGEAAEARELRAGPVRVKLADGQLRYIRVGDKEIIRRIYFAVRDDHWRTPMPQFTEYRVEDGQDHFTVHLAATCKLDQIDYRWTGTITGAPDGRIEFEAGGAPAADFRSNRIGLCILYGIPSLLEQPFETEGPGGSRKSQFPRLASPTLVAKQFHKLTYTTQGMTVTTTVDGAICDMEDQRNWGDTSWKEYAPLPYAYPNAPRARELRQKVTLTVARSGATAHAAPEGQVILKLGEASPGVRLPKIVAAGALKGAAGFSDVNMHRERFQSQPRIVWAYTPAEHLPDRDNLMDNVAGVMYQAQTAHAFGPEAKLGVGPVSFEPTKWPGHEPKDSEPFAAAWAAGFLQHAAMGGVEQVAFRFGPGPAHAVIQDLQSHGGQPARFAESSRPDVPVSGFSVVTDRGQIVWIANRTDDPVQIMLEGLGGATQANLTQLGAEGQKQADRTAEVIQGAMPLNLGSFEVLRISIGK